jgi:FkbM family methyltransferase
MNFVSLAIRSATARSDVRLALDPDQMSQRIMLGELNAGRFYESETSHFVGAILRPGDTFIDVGAHVGYFSMLAAALVGPTGRVYSFEPDARNHAHLLEHIAMNNTTHVVPVPMAVGDRSHVAEFHVNADNDGGHALWSVGNHPFNERTRQAPETRKVFVTSLDDFFGDRHVASLRAIKIDAEGGEVGVLTGARDLLRRHTVPFVIAEINRFGLQSMGTSEHALRALMTDMGYETYLFQPGQLRLDRLSPDANVECDFVFNVLFRHPNAPAIA